MSQPDFFAATPAAPAYVPDARFGGAAVPGAPAGPGAPASPTAAAVAAGARHGAPPRRSSSLKRTRMVIGGILAAVAVAGYLGVNHLMGAESAAETKTVTTSLQAVQTTRIQSDLRNAANDMEAYYTDKASYPADLAAAGYAADPATTVRVVWVTADGYCLAGAVAGKAPSSWYASQQGGLVEKAC